MAYDLDLGIANDTIWLLVKHDFDNLTFIFIAIMKCLFSQNGLMKVRVHECRKRRLELLPTTTLEPRH